MTEITQCPQCNTRFKVTQAQRESHQGMVRCGHCQAVFNAAAHLYDDEPSPQLALPIEPVEETAASASSDIQIKTYQETRNEDRDQDTQDFSYLEDVYEAPPQVMREQHLLSWIMASLALLLLLLAQASYFYRVELASNLPALKPVMKRVCAQLNCTIPLPQQPDLLTIESSTLEAEPTQANIITLNVLLRNRAPYAMAYPNLELTLTNFDDKPVARRTFLPEEYLPADNNGKAGLPANRETSVNLHLNTTDLKPAGYRLYLLYPQ